MMEIYWYHKLAILAAFIAIIGGSMHVGYYIATAERCKADLAAYNQPLAMN